MHMLQSRNWRKKHTKTFPFNALVVQGQKKKDFNFDTTINFLAKCDFFKHCANATRIIIKSVYWVWFKCFLSVHTDDTVITNHPMKRKMQLYVYIFVRKTNEHREFNEKVGHIRKRLQNNLIVNGKEKERICLLFTSNIINQAIQKEEVATDVY